jgi:hypothetical protein
MVVIVRVDVVRLLSTGHELIPAGCKRQYSAGGVQSMQVDGRFSIGRR